MLDRGEQEGGPAGRGSALETWPEEPGRPAWEEESVEAPMDSGNSQAEFHPSYTRDTMQSRLPHGCLVLPYFDMDSKVCILLKTGYCCLYYFEMDTLLSAWI